MAYKTNNGHALFAVQTAFSRQLIKYPWQLLLALLGVSIGVAVIVSIQLVRISAYESFELATLVNTGSASHQLSPLHGRTISYDLFVLLQQQLPHVRLSPVVDFDATLNHLADETTRAVYVLGIDAISQANRDEASVQRNNQQASKGNTNRGAPIGLDIREFMGDPQFAAINTWTSNNLRLFVNDPLTINVNGKTTQVFIRAVLPNQDQAGGLTNNTVLVDIATAQEILGSYTNLTRINIDIDEGNLPALTKLLPPNILLTDNENESRRLRNMTQAFYTNLTALSLMALMMGMFLIYNTETFLVLQRQRMISRLKALGVTSKQILTATLLEAAALGFVGSAAGLVLGILLAKGLLKYVSVTLNDLYFQSGATEILLSPWLLFAVVMLGVAATMCAGFLPARTAAASPLVNSLNRVSTIERKPRWYYKYFLYFSLGAFACTALCLSIFEHINGGFFAIACVLLGFSGLCVPTLQYLSHLGQHAPPIENPKTRFSKQRLFSVTLCDRIGIRTIGLGLGRAGTAAAALMIATAAGIGIGVMVASFRDSVSDWLASSLRADFYVSTSFSLDTSAQDFISMQAKNVLENLPEVLSISSVRRTSVVMYDKDHRENPSTKRTRVSGFDLNEKAIESFAFLEKVENVWPRWHMGNAVLVTEPFAYHNKLQIGDTLTLGTIKGPIEFKIIGIYKDYASEQGGVAMSRAIFDQHWNQPGYNGIGIYSSEKLTLSNLQRALGNNDALKNLKVISSQALYSQSLEVFDRTFLITDLLKVITIVVAFIGIIGALLAQQLERSREYGIYRALGFTRFEILRIILVQTISIGLTSAIIAIPAGLSVAWILIEVINPRSFGWTMSTVIPLSTLITSFMTAIAASLLAGIVPALRMSKLSPADALRYE